MKLSPIPPLTVLLRTFRPVVKVFVAIIWIHIRLIRPVPTTTKEDICLASNSDSDIGVSTQCEGDILPKVVVGLLDIVQKLITSLAIAFQSFIFKHSGSLSFIRLASTLCLFINDFLGIILIAAFFRFTQKAFRYSLTEMKDQTIQTTFDLAKEYLPFVRNELLKEEAKMEISLKGSMWKDRKQVIKNLPKEGMAINSLIEVSKLGEYWALKSFVICSLRKS